MIGCVGEKLRSSAKSRAGARYASANDQLRRRIIIACLPGLRAFAAVACLAVDHDRLRRREAEIECEIAGRCARAERPVRSAFELPVEQADTGIACRGFGN